MGYITEYIPTEHHIYGSSRLGTQNYRSPDESEIFSRNTGDKNYELSNHLGNVLAVVSDRKITPNPQPKIVKGDLFEDPRNPGWLGLNGSDLVVNGNRQLSITFNDSTAVQGATRDLNVRGGSTVFFTLKVSKGPDAAALPPGLQFQVFGYKNFSSVLYSTPVPANGIVSASFEVTNDEMLTVALTATAQQPASILLNNFYAYTLEQSLANNVTLFNPDVLAYTDYDPFGMLIPNRHDETGNYRYGFQGQEQDDEVKGEGNSINYTFRMHDPRVGRFFAVDPLEAEYAFYSPYVFSGNRVIDMNELEGLQPTENGTEESTSKRKPAIRKTSKEEIKKRLLEEAKKNPSDRRTLPKPKTTIPKPKGGAKPGLLGVIVTLVEFVREPMKSSYQEKEKKLNDLKQEVSDLEEESRKLKSELVSIEKEIEETEFVFRGGSFTNKNFTPRPNIDDGVGPKSGLSTYKDPLQATQGKGGKVQILNLNMLKNLGFQITQTPDGHVGIRPPSQEVLQNWAESRPGLDRGDPAHILTEMVKTARVTETKVKP